MSDIDEIIDARLKLMLVDVQELIDIIEKLPDNVKSETDTIYSYINSLKKALTTLPEELDLRFNTKINQILDIAQEIDKHTSILERILKIEVPNILDEQLKKSIKYNKPSYFLILLIGILGSLIGSGITVSILLI